MGTNGENGLDSPSQMWQCGRRDEKKILSAWHNSIYEFINSAKRSRTGDQHLAAGLMPMTEANHCQYHTVRHVRPLKIEPISRNKLDLIAFEIAEEQASTVCCAHYLRPAVLDITTRIDPSDSENGSLPVSLQESPQQFLFYLLIKFATPTSSSNKTFLAVLVAWL